MKQFSLIIVAMLFYLNHANGLESSAPIHFEENGLLVIEGEAFSKSNGYTVVDDESASGGQYVQSGSNVEYRFVAPSQRHPGWTPETWQHGLAQWRMRYADAWYNQPLKQLLPIPDGATFPARSSLRRDRVPPSVGGRSR